MDHKSSCSQKREAALHQISDAAANPKQLRAQRCNRNDHDRACDARCRFRTSDILLARHRQNPDAAMGLGICNDLRRTVGRRIDAAPRSEAGSDSLLRGMAAA